MAVTSSYQIPPPALILFCALLLLVDARQLVERLDERVPILALEVVENLLVVASSDAVRHEFLLRLLDDGIGLVIPSAIGIRTEHPLVCDVVALDCRVDELELSLFHVCDITPEKSRLTFLHLTVLLKFGTTLRETQGESSGTAYYIILIT